MIHIGIDPGLTGAIAIIDDKNNYEIYDTPTFSMEKEVRSKRSITPKKVTQVKTFIDRKKLLELLRGVTKLTTCHCTIEKQHMMPDQSANSGFNTGKGYGEVLMALDAVGISYEEISAKEWQKHFGISKDTKGDSCRVATNLFPKETFKTPRGRVLDGRSDAILICEFGRRKRLGKV